MFWQLQNLDLTPETCPRTLEGHSLTAPGWPRLESHPSARPEFRPRCEGCRLQSNSQVGRSQKTVREPLRNLHLPLLFPVHTSVLAECS